MGLFLPPSLILLGLTNFGTHTAARKGNNRKKEGGGNETKVVSHKTPLE